MQSFLDFLIRPLLSEPDQLTISDSASQITIKVADADVGKIIGKHGATIQAIRVLVRTYSAAHRLAPINLTVDTPPKT